ncbi:MAG: phosphoadenylyl-sulfate reductase [Lentisphaerota bacterium]
MSSTQIKTLQEELKNKGPEEVLTRVSEVFGDRVVFASALGAEDQVITDVIGRGGLKIPVITLDTGRLFNESYQLLEDIEEKYGIRVKLYFPDKESVESMTAEHGVNLFRESVENRKLCCRVRKIEPLRRSLSGYKAWICGLRREQSVTRSEIKTIEWDETNKLVKINPLADWTEVQVWEYIKNHEAPYNKLHDQGFPSIGCACCTRAVKRTEDVRAGRWWWELPEQKECGLHVVDGKLVRKAKV